MKAPGDTLEKIYIPIWLDLLYIYTIIKYNIKKRFTFQYG